MKCGLGIRSPNKMSLFGLGIRSPNKMEVCTISIAIEKRERFSKEDQFKTHYYVIIEFTTHIGVKKRYSCGNVDNESSWERAKQKLREIFDIKLQHALGELEKKKSWYIREEAT